MTQLFARAPRVCLLAAASLGWAACGDAPLDLVDAPVNPPREQTLCDEDPDQPAPVKVLLLVDTSGSLQFTDQAGTRFQAIREFVFRLADQNALVATMGFGAGVAVDPPVTGSFDPLFMPAAMWSAPAFLTEAATTTDLEGALIAARTHLVTDILQSSPEELARTRYVVVLFTDGTPTPTCCVEGAEQIDGPEDELGCPLEPWEEFGPGRYCGAHVEAPLCNDDAFVESFRSGIDNAGAPNYGEGPLLPLNGLNTGGNYNRPGGLEDAARLIGALRIDGVGAVNLHAVLLSDPSLPDVIKQEFQLNACRMQRTVDLVVDQVNGTSTLFASAGALDFGVVDTTPLCPTP